MENALSIAVHPVVKETLVGEQLLVKTAVTNASARPVTMPDIYSKSPIVYELSLKGERMRVSQAAATARSLGQDVAPPEEIPPMEIASGATVETSEDIAEYAGSPIAAGSYTLTAHLTFAGRRIASPPVPLSIVSPNPAVISSIVCPLRLAAASVLAHDAGDGHTVLLQRECAGPEADQGVFTRRVDVPSGQKVLGLAVAAQVGAVSEGRWFSWLTSSSINAARGWGVLLSPGVLTHGLKAPGFILVNMGFQFGDQDALFFALGLDGGKGVLIGFAASSDGIKEKIRVPLGAHAPEAAAVCAQSGASGGFTVVWIEKTDGAFALYCKDVSSAGAGSGDRRLYSSPFPLTGLSLDPVGVNPQGCCIEGPRKPATNYTHIRFSTAKNSPVQTTAFTVPSGAVGPIVTYSGGTSLRLMATTLDKTVVWNSAGSRDQWQVVGHGANAVSWVDILGAKGEPAWIQWFDAVSGLRFSKMPARE